MPSPSVTRRESFNKRFQLMKSEQQNFVPHWRELSDYHLAHRGRFLVSDRNKGHKRNTKQLNNTSRLAGRTLASGMMAGITSPARPWFRLSLPDPSAMEFGPVKDWLMIVERIMREIFNRSNLYNSLHAVYHELGVFGTASMAVFEDFDNVIRCKPYTVGSYVLALNGKDNVDTWAREYQLTVGQLVKQFGKENVSISTRNLWDTGSTESWVDVVHMVEPNDDRDNMSPMAKDKAWRSVYYEKAAREEKFLRESGFDEFPIMAPRWEVTGEDIYAASCPGMDALGDVKGLQISERKKYEAIDKHVDPAYQAPTSLRNTIDAGGTAPGEITYVDDPTGRGLRPVYEVNPNVQSMLGDIEKTELRISRTFYEDLFLMLANSNRAQITAREVAERHEEKLLMLGPVLERLHGELLDPLIDRTFSIALRAGIIPPPPEELQGKELKVEYISVLAQAQRLVAVGGIEQLAGFVGQLSAIWPEARHKLRPDQSIEDYANALGTSPDLVRSENEYNAAVAEEQQAALAAQQAASMPQMVDSAKTLSETDTTGDNGLTRAMTQAGVGNVSG